MLSQFLANNNGWSNAYTGSSDTNYRFRVATSALVRTLTRFSAFFKSPKFSLSSLSGALSAVDSEHQMNMTDGRRISHLERHLSKDGHVWRKFLCGNRETLSKAAKYVKGELPRTGNSANTVPLSSTRLSATAAPDSDGDPVGSETRRRVVKWWSEEYCASRMNLCVIGKGMYSFEYCNITDLNWTGCTRTIGRIGGHGFSLVFAYKTS